MTPGKLTRTAAFLAASWIYAAGIASGAHAQMRQCTDQRVEYLIGGAGKTCSNVIVGGPVPARTRAAESKTQAVPSQGAARFATFNDEGRREILQQELQLARQGLTDLDSSPALIPGAGTLEEQRLRRQGDITALQAELGRLKKSP